MSNKIQHFNRRKVLRTVGTLSIAGVLGSGGVLAQSDRGTFERKIAEVRRATAQYNDVKKAIEDGYVYDNTVPQMGHHFVNFALLGEPGNPGPQDVLQPEILVYGQANPNSRPILGAVEYADWEDERQLFDHDDEIWDPPGEPGPPFWTLHVWCHTNNPNGLFAPLNPRRQFNPPDGDPLD